MSNNYTFLSRRVNTMLTAIERMQQHKAQATPYHVVIYDLATGKALPGFEQSAEGPVFRIPDNGRDNYGGVWLPLKEPPPGKEYEA